MFQPASDMAMSVFLKLTTDDMDQNLLCKSLEIFFVTYTTAST